MKNQLPPPAPPGIVPIAPAPLPTKKNSKSKLGAFLSNGNASMSPQSSSSEGSPKITKGRKKRGGRRTSMTELMADPSNTSALADLGIPSIPTAAMPLPLPLPLPVPQPVISPVTNGGRGAGGRRRRRERNMSSMDQVLGDPANSSQLLDLGIVAPMNPTLLTQATSSPKASARGRKKRGGRRTSMTELMADPSNTLAFADLGISSAAPLPLSLPLPVPQPVEAAASTNGGRGAGGRRRRRERNMSSMDQVLGDPANSSQLLDLGIVAPMNPTLLTQATSSPKASARGRKKRGGRRTSMTELMADPSNTLAFADLGISSAAPLPLPLPSSSSSSSSSTSTVDPSLLFSGTKSSSKTVSSSQKHGSGRKKARVVVGHQCLNSWLILPIRQPSLIWDFNPRRKKKVM